MKLDPGQQVLVNFIYHYLGVTGRPAVPIELRALADGFGRGLKGRPIVELLSRDRRFYCREEGWGLSSWQVYTAIDVETTGLNPRTDCITEIALVKLWGAHVLASWSSLVNPGRPIPPYIVRLIGISDEMVEEAPPFTALIPVIRDFIGESTLVAHNAPFDRSFIDAECVRAGLEPPANPWLDTVEMAKRLLPYLPNRKLVTVADHFGLNQSGHHRAMADALMAAGIFAKMTALEEARQVSG